MTFQDRGLGVVNTLGMKAPCVAATTANITLSGEQSIDGIAVVQYDRVLVKNQTDPVENYHQIREELRLYDPELAARDEILVVNKCELPDADACAELLAESTGREVLKISAATGQGLTQLTRLVLDRLNPPE